MRPLTHFTSIPAKPRRQRYANWLRMACAVLIAGCASAMSSPLPDTDAASATDVAPGVDADVLADVEPADPQAPVDDPWEGFNRHVHGFNNTADQLVFRPLAVGYDTVAPAPVKAGVSRFFANLGMPATAVNQALQGRPRHAAQSLGRFAVNFTVGIGGVFDPATHFGVPQHSPQDFGQTLATWGWSESRYLVLPLFGPRTLRDTVAIVGDQPVGTGTGLDLDAEGVAAHQATGRMHQHVVADAVAFRVEALQDTQRAVVQKAGPGAGRGGGGVAVVVELQLGVPGHGRSVKRLPCHSAGGCGCGVRTCSGEIG